MISSLSVLMYSATAIPNEATASTVLATIPTFCSHALAKWGEENAERRIMPRKGEEERAGAKAKVD